MPDKALMERKWTQEEIDEDISRGSEDDDGYDPGEECGRWINGRLGPHCSKAGSEECDFECPYSRAHPEKR